MSSVGTGLATLHDVREIRVGSHASADGFLTVIEGNTHVPFDVARVFTIRGPGGVTRGQHAHRACSQFLLCCAGSIEVVCDDGTSTAVFRLAADNAGLLIPPGIWASEIYERDESVLTVVCDRVYEAEDYIRDYDDFLAYRRSNGVTE